MFPPPFFPPPFPSYQTNAPGGNSHGQESWRSEKGGGEDGRTGVFWKTRICNKWRDGNCPFGDTCKYAHGEQELRTLPAGEFYDNKDNRGNGEGGKYSWDGPPERGAADHASSSQQGNAPNDPQKNALREAMRKTRLCERFMNTGQCPYGNKCTFAHGFEELRRPPDFHHDKPFKPVSAAPQHGSLPPHGGHMAMDVDVDPGRMGAMPLMASGMKLPPPAVMMATGQPMPLGPQPPPGPPPPGTPAAQLLPGGPTGTSQGNHAAKASSSSQEITFVDRVRAMCAILGIGNAAAATRDKPGAMAAAIGAIRNGSAFRENPFADSVEDLLPSSTGTSS